jgi:hypothetical protein
MCSIGTIAMGYQRDNGTTVLWSGTEVIGGQGWPGKRYSPIKIR